MIKRINSENMGKSNYGWLHGNFHFSFAEYSNPLNMNFGVLRVLNHETIEEKSGLDTHPNKDIEIITYIEKRELTHVYSMGNSSILTRGQIQYMSAGTGVNHSEFNRSNENLKLLQIWIIPDKNWYEPNYGEFKFNWEERINNLMHMVSSYEGDALEVIEEDIKIKADKKSHFISIEMKKNEHLYIKRRE